MSSRMCAAIWVVVPLLASCESTIDMRRMDAQLAAAGPVFSQQTLAEVEAIQPQLRPPIRLAVAPPIWRPDRTWSREEAAEIESWGPELQRSGLVSELILLPALALDAGSKEQSTGWLQSLRVASARHRADALLVIRDVDDVSSWMNVLSIFDLTIVGAWIAPGHSTESVSIMEGSVIDNRNEYLYASARGEGSEKVTRPLAYMNESKLRAKARTGALRKLKSALMERVHAVLPGKG